MKEADRDRRTGSVTARAAENGPPRSDIYFAIVVVLSGGLEAYIWMNPSTLGTLVLPLMWTPALASVIARLILREGFSDVSFRFGGLRTWRWYAVGLAMASSTRARRGRSWWAV